MKAGLLTYVTAVVVLVVGVMLELPSWLVGLLVFLAVLVVAGVIIYRAPKGPPGRNG